MSRLQKKCFLASTGVHLLLVIILVVGPAFLTSKNKSEDLQALDFIPSILIDANLAGGGNRNAKAVPAVKPIVQPAAQTALPPTPEKQQEPEPPKTVRAPKTDPESFEPAKEPKHKPQISTTLVARKADPRKTIKPKSSDTDNQAQEQQLADARRKMLKQLASAADHIREGISSPISIEGDAGPGGGGPSYAAYAAWVKTIYENAWQDPEDATKADAITKVSVTISSDGSVYSARISRPSGDAQVDRSVSRTLERVTFIAPFPEGAKEKQRTYIINFNLKAKRGMA